MAGVKGRSGRRSHANESLRLEVIDECWNIVKAALKDLSLPLQFRAELASKHTVKSVPQELLGDMNHNVNEMPNLTIDTKAHPFVVGVPLNAESA